MFDPGVGRNNPDSDGNEQRGGMTGLAIGETQPLTTKLPDKEATLRRNLHDWSARVGAQVPAPNPKHDSHDTTPKPKMGKRQAAEILRIVEES
jgi:hypothetical protein